MSTPDILAGRFPPATYDTPEPPFCAATLVVEGVAANVLERAI